MTRRLTAVLIAVNLALAFVLAWQWLSPAGQRSTHWLAPAPVKPQLGSGPTGGQSAQGADPARTMAVLERPVFAVTRRPLPPPKAPGVAPVAPPPDPLDSVHIFGMFSGSDGGGLIIRADGKTRRLRVSESLGGWRLGEVRGTDAVFERAGQTRVVSLVQVRPGSTAASAAPVSRPIPPPPTPVPPAASPPAAQTPAPQAPAARAPARPTGSAPSPFVIGGSR